VTTNVEDQLEDKGIKIAARLAGDNGVETSRAIADFALDNGLSTVSMAFATSQNFPDALAGAAFCGKRKSVLLLCDDKAADNLGFATEHASGIRTGYVFGGDLAFSEDLFDKLPE
jgi:putative cell wall-binding protein